MSRAWVLTLAVLLGTLAGCARSASECCQSISGDYQTYCSGRSQSSCQFSSLCVWTSCSDDTDGVWEMPNSLRYLYAIPLLVVGLLLVLCGYRLFKLMLAIQGCALGLVIGGLIVAAATRSIGGTLVGGLGFGLVLAICAVKLWKLGVFLTGFLLGGSVGGLLFLQFATYTWVTLNQPPPGLIAATVVPGILVGCLAVKFAKALVIISTSFLGASCLISGGCLLQNSTTSCLVGSSNGILLVQLGVTAVGVLVQYRITRKYSHLGTVAVVAVAVGPAGGEHAPLLVSPVAAYPAAPQPINTAYPAAHYPHGVAPGTSLGQFPSGYQATAPAVPFDGCNPAYRPEVPLSTSPAYYGAPSDGQPIYGLPLAAGYCARCGTARAGPYCVTCGNKH